MKEYEILDYENGCLFEAILNKDNYINSLAIQSVAFNDENVVLTFKGERYAELHKGEFGHFYGLPIPITLDKDDIYNYFNKQGHQLTIKFLNRRGVEIKSVTYYGLTCKDIQLVEEAKGDINASYRVTLNILKG